MRSRSTTLPRPLVRTRTVAGLSDRGLRRESNQDAFLAAGSVLAVADGVGGGPAGEVASRVAIEALAPEGDVARASAAVHDAALADPKLRGMATTLTVARFTDEGLAIAHARAATHPLRNVLTRALGRDRDTDFDTFVADVEPGDVFLLCTDGLTKMVADPAIAAIVAT